MTGPYRDAADGADPGTPAIDLLCDRLRAIWTLCDGPQDGRLVTILREDFGPIVQAGMQGNQTVLRHFDERIQARRMVRLNTKIAEMVRARGIEAVEGDLGVFPPTPVRER